MDIIFYHKQDFSFREIGRKTGRDHRTVKKYSESPEPIGVVTNQMCVDPNDAGFYLIIDGNSADNLVVTYIDLHNATAGQILQRGISSDGSFPVGGHIRISCC